MNATKNYSGKSDLNEYSDIEFMNEVIDTLTDPVFVKDSNHKFVLLNDAFCKFIGHEREDLLGKSDYDFFSKEQADVFWKKDDEVFNSNKINVNEELFTDSFGVTKTISTTKSVFADKWTGKKILVGIIRDISENKNYEINNKKLHQAIEQSPLSIVITDTTGTIEYVNPKFTTLTGYSRDEVIGKTPHILQSGHHDKLFYKKLWDTILSGETWNGEIHNKKKNGELFIEEASINPVKSSDGKIINFIAIKQDITEKKRLEEEFQKQKIFYEQMFMQSSTSTQILDKDGWCERINHKLSELFYVRPEDIEGKKYNIFNDGELKKKGIMPYLEKVFNKGEAGEWEVLFDIGNAADSQNIKVSEKKTRWFYNKAYPLFDEKNHLTHVIIQHTDITDHKNSEEELHNSKELLNRVINLLPIRVFWKDKDLVYLGCNTVFAKDAGKSSPEEMIGKDDFQMGWKEQAELYRKDDFEIIKSGKPKINFEEPQTTPGGKTIWLRTSKMPLTDLHGNIIGILGTYDDVTERKNTEEELIRFAKESERFNSFAVGRELKMIELKKEINALMARLGEKPKYIVESAESDKNQHESN